MTVVTLRIHNRDGRARSHYVYLVLCQDDGPIYVRVGHSAHPVEHVRHVRANAPATPRFVAYSEVGTRSLARLVERAMHDSLSEWRFKRAWYVAKLSEQQAFRKSVQRVLARFSTPERTLTLQQIEIEPWRVLASERLAVYRSD